MSFQRNKKKLIACQINLERKELVEMETREERERIAKIEKYIYLFFYLKIYSIQMIFFTPIH